MVTSSECDEDTMCPEYKVVAVDVERVGAAVVKEKREVLGRLGEQSGIECKGP